MKIMLAMVVIAALAFVFAFGPQQKISSALSAAGAFLKLIAASLLWPVHVYMQRYFVLHMINYVQNGSRIDITTPYAVSSGGGCLVGTALFGIAVDTYGSAAAGVIATEGVFDIAKETGPSFAVGARCWWNDTTKVVTTSGTASALEVGIATSTAGTAATAARVKLHQKI